jgi:hypothetical protein
VTELLDRSRARVANAAVHAGLSSFLLADRLVAADPQLVAQTRRVLSALQTSTGRFAYPGTNLSSGSKPSGLARTEKPGSTRTDTTHDHGKVARGW